MSTGSTVNPESGTTSNPQTGERFEQAPPHAHDHLDSKDQRSIKNNLASAEHAQREQKKADEEDDARPTDAAKAHGNKPSRGAVVDEQIEDEEREYLERKGKA